MKVCRGKEAAGGLPAAPAPWKGSAVWTNCVEMECRRRRQGAAEERAPPARRLDPLHPPSLTSLVFDGLGFRGRLPRGLHAPSPPPPSALGPRPSLPLLASPIPPPIPPLHPVPPRPPPPFSLFPPVLPGVPRHRDRHHPAKARGQGGQRLLRRAGGQAGLHHAHPWYQPRAPEGTGGREGRLGTLAARRRGGVSPVLREWGIPPPLQSHNCFALPFFFVPQGE